MFEQEANDISSTFPKLYTVARNGKVILNGTIDIVDNDNKLWDSYEIEIHPSDIYPKRFPHLYETGGKIPKNADWHVYNNGSCCVTVFEKEILRCQQCITLIDYINEYVIPYLANQTYRRLTGNFANGEYSHNYVGNLEFYQELFESDNISIIINLVNWIFNNPKPSRTSRCFCGSSNKFRKCHKRQFEIIHNLGKDIVIPTLINIQAYKLVNTNY